MKQKAFILILLGFLVACEAPVESVLEENIPQQPEIVEESTIVEQEVEESIEIEPEVEKVTPTFTLRYHLNHIDEIREVVMTEGESFQLSPVSKEGYTFVGWYLEPEFITQVTWVVNASSDINLYPKFREIVKEPHELVFEDIRNHFSFDYTETHPIDYYVSPSQSQEKADIIYNGMLIAAGLLAPYLEGLDPLSITVVHPNDQEWYEEHVAKLDLFDYGDPWFERTSANGGAAVMESYSGRPHMIYNIPDRNNPQLKDIDTFVHEAFHVFQLGLLAGDRQNRDKNLGCIYTEGGATLIGNVLSFEDERNAKRLFETDRQGRIEKLQNYYAGESNLSDALYDQLVNGQNDRCNVQEPGFGYNLGALVAEKMVLDFGIENFMVMHYDFNRYRIDQVFEDRFDTNYFEWIEEEAVPYVKRLID
jgi:uncharacterized repeat protein (TIGR02543 family)